MSYGEFSYGEASYGSAGSAEGATLATLSEGLTYSGTWAFQSTELSSLAEALTFVDTESYSFFTPLYDGFVINDTSEWALTYLLRELYMLPDSIVQDTTYNRVFSDALEFTDATKLIFAELLSETFLITDTAAFVRDWDNTLRDRLNLGDAVDGPGVYGRLIADALALADLINNFNNETLTDGLALADTLVGLREMYGQLVDSVLTGDSTTYVAMFSGGVTDTLALGDAVTAERVLQALLGDELRFLLWDGNTQASYAGYVMNTQIGGLTEYHNYNFNSIAKIGGAYYGASRTGLYLLEGADDAGSNIDVLVKFGAFDPGSGKKTRAEQAYIGVRSDGKCIFKTFADDGKERWYETQALHDDLQTQRAKLGKGVKSRYWQFALLNRDGAPLELEQFEFLPITLTRRV